ncbi:MAG: hypothetical protein ACQER9_04760 [Nanobdellota archaeon]
MKIRRYAEIGAFIFILMLIILKSYFLFSDNIFDDANSYRHVYEIEKYSSSFDDEVIENYYDKSQIKGEGKQSNNMLYYILMGILYFIFGNIFALKIAELVIFGLLLAIIFFIGKDIQKNSFTGLFSIVVLAVSPFLFLDPNNSLKPSMFSFLMIFLMIFLLIKSSILFKDNGDEKKSFDRAFFTSILILGSFLLIFMADYSLFLVAILYVFVFFSGLFNFKTKEYFMEYAKFLFVFITIIYIVIHRNVINDTMRKFSSSDIPVLLNQNLIINNMESIFIFAGILNILLGIYGVYYFINKNRFTESHKVFIFSSAVICCLIILIFFVKDLFITSVLSASLAIISAGFLKRLIDNLEKNFIIKIKPYQYWLIFCIIVIIAGTSINYSYALNEHEKDYVEVDNDIIRSMEFLSSYDERLVIAPPSYSPLIAQISSNDFVLPEISFSEKSDNLKQSIKEIYTNINSVKVRSKINNFDTSDDVFIYFDDDIADRYNIDSPGFSYDKKNFIMVYSKGDIMIFKYQKDED